MAAYSLAASVRQGTGKGVARRLRRAGQMPGIVYGVGEPVPVQFDAHDAEVIVHALHGSERLISLRLAQDGGKAAERHVLLKSVQTTPVANKLLHIDFHEVDVTQTVQVSVEVQSEGEPAGERQGGILQQPTYEVAVECLPTIIPERLVIDVSGLEIGDSLHVSDLLVPEGVTLLTPEDETLFSMVAPRVEEEEEPAEPEEGEEAPEGEEADEQ